MMMIQNSPPSSIEAALSFASDHGKKLEFSCDCKCANCDKHPPCLNNCNSCSQNFPRSCSQLSTVSNMSEGPTPLFVYQRKKLQKILAQASTNTKLSDNSLSAISSEAPSMPTKEHIVSPVEVEMGAVRAPVMPPCNKGSLVSNSRSIDGYPKFVNEICSSSKSNRDLCSESLGTETDDAGECSSSGALILSEKDMCISILRSRGLLEGVLPTKVRGPANVMSITGDFIRLRPCKVCDRSETTLKMLICDQCDEAFHVSCCNPPIKKVPVDEWFCHSCLRKKQKILDEAITNRSPNIVRDLGRCRNATSKGALGPIARMLRDTESYTSNVRIGEDFQAEVPDWSGITIDEVDSIGEPLEMNPTDCFRFQDWSSSKPSRLSPIGNWIQCREVIDGVGEGVDGTICGKWRRAPLFEVQTDDWECFRSVLWDPTQSDCAVPQELDTEQVLKHLKYIEMLKPRLAAKRRKIDHTRSVDSPEVTKDLKKTQTT